MDPARTADAAPDSPDDPEDGLDRVFRALGDRTRRKLLERLSRGPANVTELAAPFAMSLPAVSKHIRLLEAAGLVGRTVEGRIHRCTLSAGPLRSAAEWIDDYRLFWTDTLDQLATYVEAGDPGADPDPDPDPEAT